MVALLPFAQNKSVFKQPPLLEEGLHTGSYFKQCIEKLTEEIVGQKSKSKALKASCLYLRGMLNIASNQPIEGLDDFHALHSASQELFPSDYVKQVIANLDDETEETLKKQDFYTRAAIFRIFSKKNEEQQPERPTRKLPSSDLGSAEFAQRAKALNIAESDDAAALLFEALTYGAAKAVTPEQFLHLYNTFTKAERELEAIEIPGGKMDGLGERVICCSPLINTARGMGRIIMTMHQLFFVADGARESTLMTRLHDVKEIIKYQHFVVFPPGVAALRIVNRDSSIPPFFACLKEDRNIWVCLLNEMAGGHESAFALKEPITVEQAANNVILTNVLLQMDVSEKVAEQLCSFARNRDSDRQELSEETRDALEMRLDPCIREKKRTTIMCVEYVKGRSANDSATIWCGLGTGTIMVYEVESWTCVSELRYAKNRMSCLVSVCDNMVWAGSFDSVIYVINTDTRKAEQQLQNHTDYISDIIYIDANDNENQQSVVWSASFDGQILKWDPETRESTQEILLKVKTLSHLMMIGSKLWCATSDAMLVVDPVKGCEIQKLRNLDKVGIPLLMDCFSRVSKEQVWAFARQNSKLFMWNTTSYECTSKRLEDNVKASVVLPIDGKVWIGCKDGKVLILDSENFSVEKKLHAHTDSVKSICMTDEGHVITGSSSKEGKLCVWNTFTRNRYDDASSLGFDVLDGTKKPTTRYRSRKFSCS